MICIIFTIRQTQNVKTSYYFKYAENRLLSDNRADIQRSRYNITKHRESTSTLMALKTQNFQRQKAACHCDAYTSIVLSECLSPPTLITLMGRQRPASTVNYTNAGGPSRPIR